MAGNEPVTELDPRYSSKDAIPIPWSEAEDGLGAARLFWLSTVRPDGRPHVTPLIAVWQDGTLYFCTGVNEVKARNLAKNRNCILTTGSNSMDEGLDLVLEGEAELIEAEDTLRRVADAYVAKYGEDWRFEVRDSAFSSDEGGRALVFGVAPAKALGFGKGTYSQTRWRFDR